jgi:hypothetical protein
MLLAERSREMGMHFLGEITIGGPIPKEDLPELLKLLDHAGVLPDGDDLRKYLDKGHLFFRDAEASYGCFRTLEDFLQAHDIEFDRWSDGTYEYDPEMVTFRKGGKPRTWPTDRDGQRVVRVCEVQELLAQKGIKETRRKARELFGPVSSPLKKIKLEELELQAGTPKPSRVPDRGEAVVCARGEREEVDRGAQEAK